MSGGFDVVHSETDAIAAQSDAQWSCQEAREENHEENWGKSGMKKKMRRNFGPSAADLQTSERCQGK
jgi:hypothetical protein